MAASVSFPPRDASPAAQPARPIAAARQLNSEQAAIVAQLSITDRHVRAHEQAHLAAAGAYATGGPSYTYAEGPDGKLYAVGGEVGLDAAADPSGPEATIEKARVIQAAANAPADPSGQDRMVAAQAAQMEAAAERQLSTKQQASSSPYAPENAPDPGQFLDLLF